MKEKFAAYCYWYDFDNYDDVYDISLKLRHGTCFQFMGCICTYYGMTEKSMYIFLPNNDSLDDKQAKTKIDFVTKILTLVFAIPIWDKDLTVLKSNSIPTVNKLISADNLNKLAFIDKRIQTFKADRTFFEECVNLLIVANHNYYVRNDEDTLLYFFKIIEKIAKENYRRYMERYFTKARVKRDKQELRRILSKYTKDNLNMSLTDNMLNTNVDYFYRQIKEKFYGNIYGKISLMINHRNIKISSDIVSMLVKCRNKLAHGDSIDEEELLVCIDYAEVLAEEFIAKKFFYKAYDDIHICAKRLGKDDEWW